MYRLLDKNLNKKLTGNGIGDEKFKYYLSCSQILFDEQNDDYDSEWIMEESECEEDQINDDDDNWMIDVINFFFLFLLLCLATQNQWKGSNTNAKLIFGGRLPIGFTAELRICFLVFVRLSSLPFRKMEFLLNHLGAITNHMKHYYDCKLLY